MNSWLRIKLELYKEWIILLGIVSSIFTVIGLDLFSLQEYLLSVTNISLPAVAALVNTLITLFVIRWGLMQKKGHRNAIAEIQKIEKRESALKEAYILLRHAYRNVQGMTQREVSITTNTDLVDARSPEHLQQVNHHDLFIKAEQLSRDASIPDDA